MHRFGIIWLAFVLVLTGCSSGASEPQADTKKKLSEAEEKEEMTIDTFVASQDAKGMLTDGPGKYGGDRYDLAKVKAEIDQFPDDLTAEEYFNRLVFLVAEDYRPIMKTIDEFDTDINFREVEAPKGPQEAKLQERNVVILLDASGSMKEKVDGGVKMDLAKRAVTRFASQLPEGTNVSLQVYGHKGSNQEKDKPLSCEGIEEVYPLAQYDQSKFAKSLNSFQAAGWTPLAASMKAAKKTLEQEASSDAVNVVYVVSDGEETCGGNPAQAAQELQQSNMKAVVNIIGFDVDDAGARALKEVARSGGGEYVTVNTEEQLQQYWTREQLRLYKAWRKWGWDTRGSMMRSFNDKMDEARKTICCSSSGELAVTYKQEEARLREAKNYLVETHDLPARIAVDLNSFIYQRWSSIFKHGKKRFEEKAEEIRRNKDHLEKEINAIRDMNLEKYDPGS
ncbi:VWA domain-containing protein [Desmospora activa]|uniref:Ca-activated chloride channel family protein n=1 Tax=Desmospora activa DSM 45169 TaxID=1121389 RepID=A0A2T4ZD91_9BACL|nr:VWA domain-containing protein [Desmospora activa]PTM59847.1 Ca-activated chloride channel family protein [Desmospora activa DSM 45169]